MVSIHTHPWEEGYQSLSLHPQLCTGPRASQGCMQISYSTAPGGPPQLPINPGLEDVIRTSEIVLLHNKKPRASSPHLSKGKRFC